jgi:hypothetical protein
LANSHGHGGQRSEPGASVTAQGDRPCPKMQQRE